jgi:alpha-mannosidase
MLPSEITFNGVKFQLAKNDGKNAMAAKGQSIKLPEGEFNRVYVLAASADGDQKATFEAGANKADLNVDDWGGFIGQWDDRQWSGTKLDVDHANYGQMTGLKQGFIKRADLAWYCDHHHDATGKNVTYSYSYLFGYGIDLPAGAKTLKLPNNDKIRILAISVAEEGPAVSPADPLYDVLPSPHAKPGVIAYVNSSASSAGSQ